MWRRLLPCVMACSVIVAAVLLLVLSSSRALASSSAVAAAPTPDATTVLNAANEAVSQAQNVLNIVNAFAAILAVVLTLFGLTGIVLSILGTRSLSQVNTHAKEIRAEADKTRNDLRASMTEIRAEADKTRQALIYIGLGDRLQDQRNTTEAVENYRKAGSLLPADAQVQYVLGRIYSGLGYYQDAIAALEAAHPQEPMDQARVLKELGLAYRRRGTALNQPSDYDTAIQNLQKAVALNPNDSDTLAILGGQYRRQGKYAQALDSYEQAWRINPGSSYALGNLASLSWYLGKQQEAQMYFGYAEVAAIGRIKKGQSEVYWDYYDQALAQLAQGKLADATQTYALAIKETPSKVQFEGVLDNLHLLQKAPQPMPGLDDVVKLIEAARDRE